MNRLLLRQSGKFILLGAVILFSQSAFAFRGRGQNESWASYSNRLRGLAETYKKWGITFKLDNKMVFNSQAGPLPSYFKVVSGFESPDTLSVGIETGLGDHGENAVAIAGEFKTGPDGNKLSGNGVVYLKGSGVGGKFKYDKENGFQMEAGLEETFYSLGINLGNDEKGPFALGLKLGPAKIEVDLLKWVKRCKEVAPFMAKAGAAKVGGVMVRADVPDLTAAIANAPEPKRERFSTVAVVSLKSLAAGKGTDRITSIRGVAVDSQNHDLLLLGNNVAGESPLNAEDLIVLCKSVGKAGLIPYVSIDPDPQDYTRPHKGRIGGLPGDLEKSLVAQKLLEIDYALKSVVMGKVEIEGLKSFPRMIQDSDSIKGQGAARFWFVPKALFPGDIEVERGAGLSVYWFTPSPTVRTEPVDFGLPQETNGSYKALTDALASNITQHLSLIESKFPAMQLDSLRQIFGIATALTILRQDPNQDVVREVIDQVSSRSVPTHTFNMEFEPLKQTVSKDGGTREFNVAGGVYSSATIYGGTGAVKTIDAIRGKSIRNAAGKSDTQVNAGGQRSFVTGEKVSTIFVQSSKYAVAAFYLSKGDYKSAATEIERIIKSEPTAYDALLLKMQATLYQNDWSTMLVDSKRYIKAKPNDGMGYYWKGVAEESLGMITEARVSADKGIQLKPKFAGTYLLRSSIRSTRDLPGAIADATKSIELSPENPLAYSMRGQYYGEKRQYFEAIEDFEKAVSLNPTTVNDWRYLGLYRMYVDRTAESAEAFTRAIALEPFDPYTYFARGDLRFKQGNWQQAIEDYEKATSLDPSLKSRTDPKIEECRKRIGGG